MWRIARNKCTVLSPMWPSFLTVLRVVSSYSLKSASLRSTAAAADDDDEDDDHEDEGENGSNSQRRRSDQVVLSLSLSLYSRAVMSSRLSSLRPSLERQISAHSLPRLSYLALSPSLGSFFRALSPSFSPLSLLPRHPQSPRHRPSSLTLP